jgi:glycosyltransferase involved in cell wall biosynthesis
MKITFVLSSLGIRGGHRVVYEYANRLQERGHEVSIVYPINPPFPGGLLRHYGLRNSVVMFFKLPNLLRERGYEINVKLIKVLTLSLKLKWVFERKTPDADVIIATDFRTAYPVAKLGEEKGKKFYFIQDIEYREAWNSEECWKRAEKIEKDPEKISLAMVDMDTSDLPFHKTKKLIDQTFKHPLRKITISSWTNELIEEKFGEKGELVFNGLNFNIFYNENKTYNKKKRILAPYQTAKYKGAEDAIKAFEIVRARFPDTHFVMFDFVRGGVPDWIEFHVNPSDDDLRKLYSSCDIFVFPSWVEGFGLPPMEAMACKCAVVATNVGAIPDYTIPGETALVSPPRKPELLAENISYLLENEDRLKEISDAGSRYIRQFTWEKAVDEFERVLGG